MGPQPFGRHDVVQLAEPIDEYGATFPAGTECVVLDVTEQGECTVEVLEPRREIIHVPAGKLADIDP